MPSRSYHAGIDDREESIVIDDRELAIIHAAEHKSSGGPEGHTYFAALCDGRGLVPTNHFDPDAENACPQCRAFVIGG
jgi:hypothetical protein